MGKKPGFGGSRGTQYGGLTLFPPQPAGGWRGYGRKVPPPGTHPRIILTAAPWTAPGGPGPYIGVLGRLSSVVARVCGVTRSICGPLPLSLGMSTIDPYHVVRRNTND